MNLLFTGATGFLGRNVCPILRKTYEVDTVGISSSNTFQVNLAKNIPDLDKKYDIILHAAGKAHSIPKTHQECRRFYEVNLQGTKNLCVSLERAGVPSAFIFVSTVAVYGCDAGDNITEEHPLNGKTPYADSKKKAEAFLMEWCDKNKVILSIIRPSLIVGSNPPGNLGAMICGIRSGRYFSIGGGTAKKSVMLAEDIAHLVPLLANKGGIYNICDSYQPCWSELEMVICNQLGKKKLYSIPYSLAKVFALFGDCLGSKAPINSLKLRKMTSSLTFSNRKAVEELGWVPLSVLRNFKIK